MNQSDLVLPSLSVFQEKLRGPGWVAQLVGACPIHWKVASSIPSQGTYLGCRFNPWSGCIEEATDRCFLSPQCFFLSLILPLSLSQINKPILGWGRKARFRVNDSKVYNMIPFRWMRIQAHNPTPGYLPKRGEWLCSLKQSRTSMFTAALFIKTQNEKQPNASHWILTSWLITTITCG